VVNDVFGTVLLITACFEQPVMALWIPLPSYLLLDGNFWATAMFLSGVLDQLMGFLTY
jgi:hypothetical protein